jgi:hypothetical protein
MSSPTRKEGRRNVHAKVLKKKRIKSVGRAKDTVGATDNERGPRNRKNSRTTLEKTGNRSTSSKTRRKNELRQLTQSILIKGRSKLDKARLIKAVRDAQ